MGFIRVSIVHTWSDIILPQKLVVVLLQTVKPVSSLAPPCILPAPDVHGRCVGAQCSPSQEPWDALLRFPCWLLAAAGPSLCGGAVQGLKLGKGRAFHVVVFLAGLFRAHSLAESSVGTGRESFVRGQGMRGSGALFSCSERLGWFRHSAFCLDNVRPFSVWLLLNALLSYHFLIL